MGIYLICIFFKWTNPGIFLFIFVLFKHKFYKKTVGYSGIQTWIVAVEGKHADHSTTTTAPLICILAVQVSKLI